MAEINNETVLGVKYEFLPWLQKGLSAYIEEQDNLANPVTKGQLLRPSVKIETKFKKETIGSDGKPIVLSTAEPMLTKTAELVGPGDVTAFYHTSIKQVVPSDKSAEFQSDYYPFIEFYEEDFPWRYTPARASSDDKLRPWIAILLCKEDEFLLEASSEGLPVLKILADNQEKYSKIFIDPAKTYACAHSQFTNTDFYNSKDKGQDITDQLSEDPDIGISRLIGVRKEVDSSPLEANTKYMAFLVPAFETGRLRGLGEKTDSFKSTNAQLHSWEKEYGNQAKRKRGLEFPVYYNWQFQTQGESFDALARKLTPISRAKQIELKFPASISVDVTNMGEGFEYDKLIDNNRAVEPPKRKSIVVSVATVPETFKKNEGEDIKYPKHSDEYVIEKHLKELLSQNYVLSETNNIYDGDDDPLITPPIYGARQISAKSLNSNKPWYNELNMDVRYRVAAGLGKKVVQQNQEEFVHRAWDVIEKINEQNQKIRQTVFGANARRALVRKRFATDKNNRKATLMFKVASMKRTKAGNTGITLENVLSTEQLNAMASSTATVTANNLCMITGVSSEVMTEKLAKSNIFGFKDHKVADLISVEQIQKLLSKECLGYHLYDLFLEKYPFMKPEFPNEIIRSEFNKGEDSDTYYMRKSNILGHLFTIKQSDDLKNRKSKPFVNWEEFADEKNGAKWNYPDKWVRQIDYTVANIPKISKLRRWMECKIDVLGGKSASYVIGAEVKTSNDRIDFISKLWFTIDTMKLYKESAYNIADTKIRKDETDFYIYNKKFEWETCFVKRSSSEFSGYDFRQIMFRGYKDSRNDLNVIMLPKGEYEKLFDKYSLCSRIGGQKDANGIYFVSDKILQYPQYCTPYLIVPYHKTKEEYSNQQNYEKGYFEMVKIGSKLQIKDTPSKPGYMWNSKEVNGVAEGFRDEDNGNDIAYFDNICDTRLKNDPYEMCYNLFVLNKNKKKENTNGVQYYKEEYNRIRLVDLFSIHRDMIDNVLNYPDTFKIDVEAMKKADESQKYNEYATPWDWYNKWATQLFSYDLDIKRDQLIHNNKIKTLEELENIIINVHFAKKESEYPAQKKESQTSQITVTSSDGKSETYPSSDALKVIADSLGAPIARTGSTLSQYPMLVYPQFPDPVYYYLKTLSTKYILPCVDNLPLNSITMFKNNPVFEQAFLCGMNTEMGSELLWREYPTDGRGSYFRKFWDTDSDKLAYGADEEYFDIKPIDKWIYDLGNAKNCQSANSGEMIIFAIKGDLIRNYPGTQVYLHKGTVTAAKYIVLDENESASDFKYEPEMSVLLKEDVYLVGFRVPLKDIKGTASKPGYFLTFKERMGETRFGVGQDSDSKKVTFETLSNKSNNQAALVAQELLNYPSLYGKHICQFT
jgi:hypothetical protein